MPLYEQVNELRQFVSKDYMIEIEYDELAHIIMCSVG